MISDQRLRLAVEAVDEAILASLPEPEQCEHVFSEQFEKKMQRVIRRSAHPVARKVLLRAACILLVLSLLLGSLIAFDPNIRAAVIDWFKDLVGDFCQYSPAVQTRMAVEPSYYLSNLPDGYRLVVSQQLDSQCVQIYCDDSNQMIRFTCLFGNDHAPLFNKEIAFSIYSTTVHGFPAEVYIATDRTLTNNIIWTDSNTGIIFFISGNCSKNELIWLAEGVTVTEP